MMAPCLSCQMAPCFVKIFLLSNIYIFFPLQLNFKFLLEMFLLFESCLHVLKFVSFYRDYVQRAFASVSEECQKDEMERCLRVKLKEIFDDHTAWSKDWSKEPLPE